MGGRFAMAIDVGVTNVKAALVDPRGQLTCIISRPTPLASGAAGVSGALVETCREVLQRGGLRTKDPVAVGCAVPGSVSPEDGVIVSSATPSWVGVDVRDPLTRSFERSVTVESEGNAATLGFCAFGPARGQDHLLGLVLGTGISCGYVHEGRLLRGAGHTALEAGHLPLFTDGQVCSCGLRGCWEAHAGGGALRSILAARRAAGDELPALPEELADLAAAGDAQALGLWESQGALLGLGIAALLNVLNPRSVILGGGFASSWRFFKKALLRTARERALPRASGAAILCSPNPGWATLLGAAVAAVRAQGPADFFVDEVPSGT
ncbi:MAG TPA: ROK family protein [Myxococcota bacterium]|nr:ROK family protein [Myxococcota bacterium]HRY96463.1 ROK family protein [Myxococcota bacterium]HSA22971.1 ROK family protein [Myxococcota bacterium]